MIYDYIKDLDLKVIIEAGGHEGEDTLKLHNLFPNAEITVCEPIPELREKIRDLRLQKVLVLEYALSDVFGKTVFYLDKTVNGAMGASSLLPVTKFFSEYVNKEERIIVDAITLPELIEAWELGDTIDLLWLDIEMMEYRVLKASEHILKNIKYIYLELSYERFREGQGKVDDVDKLLTDNGFKQIFIEPQGHPEISVWKANALYSRV